MDNEFWADELIRERVRRGAALLDEHEAGWAARINLSTLNIAEPCLCILGQVFGEYANIDGLEEAMGNALDTVAHGFDITYGAPLEIYQRLQDAWIPEITKRLNTGASVE